MWKPVRTGATTSTPAPVQSRLSALVSSLESAVQPHPGVSYGDLAAIGKGLVIKGEITGTESIFINGKVEGCINLPGSLVTIGAFGEVKGNMTTCIVARQVVVMGRVYGNVTASDRVEIRAEGGVIGSVVGARVVIQDGAYFKGSVDIRKPESKLQLVTQAVAEALTPAAAVAVSFEAPKPSRATGFETLRPVHA
jgi:cytoskeletal protein CcmA (bactofilin family)